MEYKNVREAHVDERNIARDNIDSPIARAQSFSAQTVLRPHIWAQRGARCNAGGMERSQRGSAFSLHERYQALLKVHKHREVKREL